MKKTLSLLFAVLCAAACQLNELSPEIQSDENVLYASMESIDVTKTSMDEYNNVLWSEEDQLVAFMKTTLGIKYQVKEQYVGTTTGGFGKVQGSDSGDDLESGQEIDHNVVLYPYSDQVWCMKYDNSTPARSYKLNVVLPDTQTYAENSFSNGSFPMVAVSTNNQLTFRNICGGVKLQFKGADKIKSIKLEGVGGEAISGKSSVVAYADESTPTITMANTASKSVTLDCGDGVQLNETTPTTFIVAVPPVTFASGMKITITDTDGMVKTLTNSSSNTVKRSTLLKFPVITYKQDGVLEFPEGAVTSYELPAEGGTVEVPVITNLDYEVVIPDDASDWISVVETKALREEMITLNIFENTTAEERLAEVLVITTSGIISQSIAINQLGGNPPQPGDYVDEYGINHGQGVKIGEVIWAPVNCGYHATDFKYGKLYQWGRKYGQGYDGPLYDENNIVGTYTDGILPIIASYQEVTLDVLQSQSNSNTFFLSQSGQWIDSQNPELWNDGDVIDPVKTIYDPCPSGWRVPTWAELDELCDNYSSWSKNSIEQDGYWFSGASPYGADAPQIFLPASGHIASHNGNAYNRCYIGYYLSSSSEHYLDIHPGEASKRGMWQGNGCSVRCVKETSVPRIYLSKDGTANSYIVSKAGLYKFTPTKGNSDESVGSIASAEVLWESFGTDVTPNVGDLVKNVKYADGIISFETPSEYKEGNAVIAAKDASGNILWSWHIWLTDQPEGQVYYNNAGTMMDRNLGATSATPGDVGALGLLYQWGRKDPFLGAALKQVSYEAKSTITWPTLVDSDSNTGTISYATANPTVFITFENHDWHYASVNATSSDRWTESDKPKSVYDPCPQGWRVPDGGYDDGIWVKVATSSVFSFPYDSKNRGMNFSGKFGNSSNIWYPAAGSRYCSDTTIDDVGYYGFYWSAAYYRNNGYLLFIRFDESCYVSFTTFASSACSVRCISE